MQLLLSFLRLRYNRTHSHTHTLTLTFAFTNNIIVWYVVSLCVFSLAIVEGGNIEGGSAARGTHLFSLSRNHSTSRSGCSKGKNLGNELELAPILPSSGIVSDTKYRTTLSYDASYASTLQVRGGAAAAAALNPFPSGYNPLGYGLTDLGKSYLEFEGSLDSDVGRFLSTMKGSSDGYFKRKSAATMKEQWLEIVRVSKKAQSMRIYRTLDDLIEFCLRAGFID